LIARELIQQPYLSDSSAVQAGTSYIEVSDYPSSFYIYQHFAYPTVLLSFANMYTPLLLALLSCAFAAPVIRSQGSEAIAGKWIVKLKGDVTSLAENDLRASISTSPDFDYSMAGFRGFAGTLSDEELARLQDSEHVRIGL
jgi:hypothetical protein